MTKTWQLLRQQNKLVSDDAVVGLTAKSAAVLEVLIQHTGKVVSRDEIVRLVWKGIHVTPDLVREYVSDLRRALEDDASAPRYIETIRGKGFRLIGSVSIAEREELKALVDRPRIAVLRPVILGDAHLWQGFEYSIGSAIVFNLAKFPDLVTLSFHTTSNLENGDLMRKVAQLRADFVVAVTIEILDNVCTVNAQIIGAFDYSVLSAVRHSCEMAEVSGLPISVARLVASELGRFSGHIHRAILRKMRMRPQMDRTAYEEYLLSVECESNNHRDAWRRGLDHASRAITLDSGFARAWHMRATFLRGLVTFFRDPDLDWEDALSQALVSVRKAVSLDPSDPQILAWSRHIHVADGDIAAARNAVVRAADLGDGMPDTLSICALEFCQVLGAFQDGMELMDAAMNLIEHPPDWYALVECRVAFFAGYYDRSVAAAGKNPDALHSLLFCSMSLAALGNTNAALKMFDALGKFFPQFRPESYAEDMIVDNSALRVFEKGLGRLARMPTLVDRQVTVLGSRTSLPPKSTRT